MADIPWYTLNNGTKILSVGMGCWMEYAPADRVRQMVELSLKHGYRHFDTADMYGNQAELGKAIKESGIPREEVYICTKLNNTAHHRVKEAFEKQLAELGLDYLDLYLMHWPQAYRETAGSSDDNYGEGEVVPPGEYPTFIDTWKQMEELLDTGKVKSIGVSNFSIKTLSELLPHCKVPPVTNQVELHPCLPQEDLKAYCKEKGILLTAYCPLGGQQRIFLEEESLVGIANKRGVTPGQVALSWGVQRGTAVIPKTENEGRMKTNIALIQLSDEEMQTINDIHKKPGWHRSLWKQFYYDEVGAAFGWTYEQLGWRLKEGGYAY